MTHWLGALLTSSAIIGETDTPVRRLIDREEQSGGEHGVVWNGRSDTGAAVPSGVYFYRFLAPGYEKTQRMMLIR